ncbi:peptidoglycan glycosyltransferase [Alicyclobacillaceae bacterium I2511]|nr:peptidoglycan glycosyltransferase [Alicyclobacillaceae bacterium I2511]
MQPIRSVKLLPPPVLATNSWYDFLWGCEWLQKKPNRPVKRTHDSKKSPDNKARHGWKLLFRILFPLVFVVVLFVFAFALAVRLTPFDASKLVPNRTSTIIYAKNGSILEQIPASGATDLSYNQIPRNLQEALVATEDHNYWTGSSIDMRGILRAAFVDLWKGEFAQGGSTLQQQLAKMVFLTDQKTFQRKFQQVILGVQIDRYYTKQEILAMYLNRVFLGENAVGVEQAAERYFGVNLAAGQKLTLDEAALLAGLPQAPSGYDPLQYPKAALARRNVVLQNMVNAGYLSQAKADAAAKQPLGASFHSLPQDNWNTHPVLTNFLFDYANRYANLGPDMLLSGGLKIYTTIDPSVQSAVDQVFWGHQYDADFPSGSTSGGPQGAAIFLNPKTGGVLGAAASRWVGYAYLGEDRILNARRSPGSSIKPILEYAPAIESGKFSPSSMLDNTPHDFGGGYTPQNDEANSPPQVTLTYGLAMSQNVASTWLLQQIGINTGVNFAENDGIPFTATDRQHLGIAIGGMENGVTPWEMAQGYEAFDNQGIQMEAHLIDKVVNASGQVIYAFQPAAKRIMSAQTAATLTKIMEGTVQYGTGQLAAVPGWGVAGKTGTVQYSYGLTGKHPDWISTCWFDGYTPNMVGSVYIGYDTPSPTQHMTDIPYAPSWWAAKVWGDVTHLAVAGQPPQTFNNSVSAPTSAPATVAPKTQNGVNHLTATWDSTTNAVQLTWQSPVVGGANYIISRAATAGGSTGPAQQIGETQILTFEDPTVQMGGVYTYTVQAVDVQTGANIGAPGTITLAVQSNPGGGTPANNGTAGNNISSGAGNGPGVPTGGNNTGPNNSISGNPQNPGVGGGVPVPPANSTLGAPENPGTPPSSPGAGNAQK